MTGGLSGEVTAIALTGTVFSTLCVIAAAWADASFRGHGRHHPSAPDTVPIDITSPPPGAWRTVGPTPGGGMCLHPVDTMPIPSLRPPPPLAATTRPLPVAERRGGVARPSACQVCAGGSRLLPGAPHCVWCGTTFRGGKS